MFWPGQKQLPGDVEVLSPDCVGVGPKTPTSVLVCVDWLSFFICRAPA